MLYILFMLIFGLLVTLVVLMKKQNSYFQQHGLNVIGHVVAIQEVSKRRRNGVGSYMVKLPVIEYAHKGQTWHIEGDVHAPEQHQMGEIVNLLVHPELPIAMSQKQLEERGRLLFIFTGLLIVPVIMCFGVYQFSDVAQTTIFDQYGITGQHVDDIIGLFAMLTLVFKFLIPMYKRWKQQKDASFLGLPFNAKVCPKHRAVSNEQIADSTMV